MLERVCKEDEGKRYDEDLEVKSMIKILVTYDAESEIDRALKIWNLCDEALDTAGIHASQRVGDFEKFPKALGITVPE